MNKLKLTINAIAEFLEQNPGAHTLAKICSGLSNEYDVELDHNERDQIRVQMLRDSRIKFAGVPGGVWQWQ